MKTLLLTAPDLAQLVRQVGIDALMDDVIARLARACREYDPLRHEIPVRSGFFYETPATGLLEWMPAREDSAGITIKLVGYHPTNPSQRGLPTILSVALTFDTTSGRLTGLVDGNFLTALRTGAASAVASRFLARPDARTLGLIGCGAQAVTQLHALSRIFELERVLIHDIDHDVRDGFAARVARLALDGVVFEATSPGDILACADILCTQTSVPIGAGPVFQDENVAPGLHINAVGSDFPGKTEVPASLLRRSLVCPDILAQAVCEGECQQLDAAAIGPDLATLAHVAVDGHYRHDGVSVFDSTGWALEDHVTVAVLLAHARALGMGSEVELQSRCRDPLDPYGFADGDDGLVLLDPARTATP